MEWIDYGLILLLVGMGALIVRYLYRSKKRGGKCVGCPGDCDHCSGCAEEK